MVRPRELLAAAGFGHLPFGRTIGLALVALSALGLSLVRLTGLLGVGLAGSVLGAAALVETLLALRAARQSALVATLPEVAEAVASGIASGLAIGDCLEALCQAGPKSLRASLAEFKRMGERGYSLEASLRWLQVELSNVYADQLVQLLLVSLRVGGSGLVGNLNKLAADIRLEGALQSELKAKQGWVSGTAKLGLAAPWLIVLFLNQRPEAHTFYASTAGFNLLLTGLVICLLAYLLIQLLSGLPTARRVYIDVS